MGKTSLALDIARHVAVVERIPVGIFSLNESRSIGRSLAMRPSWCRSMEMRTGKLSDAPGHDDFPRIGQAMGVLSSSLYIDDSPMSNIMEIRTKAGVYKWNMVWG